MKEGLFFTELFCLSFHQLQYCHTAYFPNAQPGSQRIFQQYYATTCEKTLAATQGSESLKHRSWKVNFLVSFQVLFSSLLKTVNQNQNQSVLSARRVLQIVNRFEAVSCSLSQLTNPGMVLLRQLLYSVFQCSTIPEEISCLDSQSSDKRHGLTIITTKESS